jgi:hypothetical protein
MRRLLLSAALSLSGCDQVSSRQAIDPLAGGELVLKEEEISIDRLSGFSMCRSNVSLLLTPAGEGKVSFCDGSQKTIQKDRKLYEKVRSTVAPFRKVSKLIIDGGNDRENGIFCDSFSTDRGSILIRWGNDRYFTFALGCSGPATLTAQTRAKEINALIESLEEVSQTP